MGPEIAQGNEATITKRLERCSYQQSPLDRSCNFNRVLIAAPIASNFQSKQRFSTAGDDFFLAFPYHFEYDFCPQERRLKFNS